MGKQGDRLTAKSTLVAEDLVRRLAPLGEVSGKKIFGGFGIFESGLMFTLVSSNGPLFLKVDDSNQKAFETAGSDQHGRMPYFSLPNDVLSRDGELRDWAGRAIEIAHRAKAKGGPKRKGRN